MWGRRRQGDLIPGFDSTTGKAVAHVRDEWDRLTKDLTIDRRDCYLIARDSNGLAIYEIYDEDNQAQVRLHF